MDIFFAVVPNGRAGRWTDNNVTVVHIFFAVVANGQAGLPISWSVRFARRRVSSIASVPLSTGVAVRTRLIDTTGMSAAKMNYFAALINVSVHTNRKQTVVM